MSRRRKPRAARPTRLMWENARTLYETGGHGIRQLARKLGVAPSTVLRRIAAEQWTKGPDPDPEPATPPEPDTPRTSEIDATPTGKDPVSRVADDRRLAVLDPMAPVSLDAGLDRLPERAQPAVEAELQSRMVPRDLTPLERAQERAERAEQDARDRAERDLWAGSFVRMPEVW